MQNRRCTTFVRAVQFRSQIRKLNVGSALFRSTWIMIVEYSAHVSKCASDHGTFPTNHPARFCFVQWMPKRDPTRSVFSLSLHHRTPSIIFHPFVSFHLIVAAVAAVAAPTLQVVPAPANARIHIFRLAPRKGNGVHFGRSNLAVQCRDPGVWLREA